MGRPSTTQHLSLLTQIVVKNKKYCKNWVKWKINGILIILAYVHTQRDDILIMVCKIEKK